MDKLTEHAIRMLEIADANDISVIGNKQCRDIARSVYDTILQVQMLKTALLHKTENCSEIPNNCEPQTDEDIVRPFGFNVESYRQAKAKDEPQTERSE